MRPDDFRRDISGENVKLLNFIEQPTGAEKHDQAEDRKD